MTISPRSAPLGAQEPRLSWVPEYESTSGPEVVALAELAGLSLDPWQQHVITHGLGERGNKWAAFEVGLVVARQNGKGGILEALELGALFLYEDVRLIIHSAHQFDTAMEAFQRLLGLIEDTPELSRLVAKRGVVRSHGQEGIQLKNGKRIRFRTRTSSGGRGFSADLVILDEAMVLSKAMHGALMPTVSAKPNPQIWYTGSAVDEEVHADGWVFAKVRERGVAGGDPSLAFFEWSVDPERYRADPATPLDPEAWAQANPAMGIRITSEYVAAEQRSLSARTFEVERLSIGHWPSTDEDDGRVIGLAQWLSLGDHWSQIDGTPVFGVDVTPDRSKASVGVSGGREDGSWHVEVVENRAGTEWVVPACKQIKSNHPGARFVIDPRSAAGSLIQDFKNERLRVVEIPTVEYGRACGEFLDAANEGTLHYPPPQPELDTALGAATKRRLGDSWAWDRRNLMDISPLVAATLAFWGAKQPKKAPRFVSLSGFQGDSEAKP